MITIEAIIYTIRIGANNNKFGDTYTAVCTATKIDPDTVRITAMVNPPDQPITTTQFHMLARCTRFTN